jgi:hypothetical protein
MVINVVIHLVIWLYTWLYGFICGYMVIYVVICYRTGHKGPGGGWGWGGGGYVGFTFCHVDVTWASRGYHVDVT